MAKVQQKSEKNTPFGGIFAVFIFSWNFPASFQRFSNRKGRKIYQLRFVFMRNN